MGDEIEMGGDWSIASMDVGDFYLTPYSSVPRDDPNLIDFVMVAFAEMTVPGVQFWMPRKRMLN